ncbi:hypothetical protein [Gehongia tenuis]|uniref:Uncharacterized protein n=1 Tax=Gehongia tenuis TaxID=2763655 RepID=A0A926HNM9_9FIRM|nr:hypothetical protein [Gehongia tenuis]MBC8530328.1 hypothetical protein [Gehongia tenuis]
MDDIGSLVVFAIIAIVGLVSSANKKAAKKAQEAQKEAQKRPVRRPANPYPPKAANAKPNPYPPMGPRPVDMGGSLSPDDPVMMPDDEHLGRVPTGTMGGSMPASVPQGPGTIPQAAATIPQQPMRHRMASAEEQRREYKRAEILETMKNAGETEGTSKDAQVELKRRLAAKHRREEALKTQTAAVSSKVEQKVESALRQRRSLTDWDTEDLRRAVVWSEILGEPRSRRMGRRA